MHADGGLADAAGAALFVAGVDAWPALARDLGLGKVLAVADDGGLQVTRGLAPALRWQRPAEAVLVD
ncbi:MAG: hypothetical protein NVS9B10_09790 [Nevskia sp.]